MSEALRNLAEDLMAAQFTLAARLAYEVLGDAARIAGDEAGMHEAAHVVALLDSTRAYTEGDVALLDSAIGRAADAAAKLSRLSGSIGRRQTGVRLLARSGDPAAALRQALAACDTLDAAAPDHDVLIQLLFLGRELYEGVVGRSAVDAAPFFEREAAILERAGEPELALCAKARLGCAHAAQDRPERAITIIESLIAQLGGLRVMRGTSPDDAQVDMDEAVDELPAAQYWSARSLEATGRFDYAEDRLRRHPWRTAGDRQAEMILRLAMLSFERERYQQALDELEDIPDGETPAHAAAAALRARIAAVLETPEAEQAIGRAEAALRDAIEAVAENARSPLTRARPGQYGEEPHVAPMRDLLPLARLFLAEARLELHAELAEAVLNELEELAGDAGQAVASLRHRIRGDALVALGRLEEAEREYEAAVEDRLRTDASGEEEPLRAIAEASQREGRLQRGVTAALSLRLARVARLRGRDPRTHLEHAIETAQQLHRIHLLADALLERGTAGDLETAADVVEAIRADLRDVDLQLGALAGKDRVYARLLSLAQERGDAAGALRTMERCKARALLDARSAAAPVRVIGSGDASMLRQRIVRELRRMRGEGADENGVRRVREWKSRLSAIYRRQILAARTSARATATAEEVLALTDARTGILHLFCGDDGTHMVVARDGGRRIALRFAPKATADAVSDLVRTLRAQVMNPGEPRALGTLGTLLLAPIAEDLEGLERLRIFPHGPLHAVPFHALPLGGAPLLERLTVCYAPSASIARACSAELSKPRPAVSAAFGVAETPYLQLAQLPNAAAEVEDIRGVVDGLQVFVSDDASRRALFSLRGELDSLHFACHADFDSVDPLASRLFLATGPVYGYELFGLAVRPRVVVLSACHTGVHTRRAGDELFGVARAFLSTGAGCVVASAWALPDKAARVLVHELYAARRDAADPATALRRAQLALRRTPEFSRPLFWAGWTAVGGFMEA